MPTVLFKRLRDDAIIPQYATHGASGMDVASPIDITIKSGETVLIPLGFAVAVPDGWELQVRPRSGLSRKTKIRVANAPGTIDSDYRGEVGIIIDNISDPDLVCQTCFYPIDRGDRIAQLVLCPVARVEMVETDELPPTKRGEGGFGSTGK